MNDSLVRCADCHVEKKVNFGYCLQHGWPKCCNGYTMTLVKTEADIDKAVGGIVNKASIVFGGKK